MMSLICVIRIAEMKFASNEKVVCF